MTLDPLGFAVLNIIVLLVCYRMGGLGMPSSLATAPPTSTPSSTATANSTNTAQTTSPDMANMMSQLVGDSRVLHL